MDSNQSLKRKWKSELNFWHSLWEDAGEHLHCTECWVANECNKIPRDVDISCGEFLEKQYLEFMGVEDE